MRKGDPPELDIKSVHKCEEEKAHLISTIAVFSGMKMVFQHRARPLQDTLVFTPECLEQGGSRWNLYQVLSCFCNPSLFR